jgi:hypothetical protein
MCFNLNLPIAPALATVGSDAVVFFAGLAVVAASFFGVILSDDVPSELADVVFEELLDDDGAGAGGAARIVDAAVTCTPLPEFVDIVASPDPTDKVSPDIPGAFAPTK